MLEEARKLHKGSKSRERELTDSKQKLVAVETEWSKTKHSLYGPEKSPRNKLSQIAQDSPRLLIFSKSQNDKNLHSIKEELPQEAAGNLSPKSDKK